MALSEPDRKVRILTASTFKDYQAALALGAKPLKPKLVEKLEELVREHPAVFLYTGLDDAMPLLDSLSHLGLKERIETEYPDSIASWWMSTMGAESLERIEDMLWLRRHLALDTEKKDSLAWNATLKARKWLAKTYPLIGLTMGTDEEPPTPAIVEAAWDMFLRSGLAAPMSEEFTHRLLGKGEH
jgi:hypothetical protein